ncbi:MAG: phosphomannomutase/phosphoglucomutase [Eubacteriaceae bacterium]|nr:phosphomannomutase/phosphoglucomutase [Eubacteriaceae bacterium]
MDFTKLQNGSDIRGVAMGEGLQLSNDVAFAIGAAFALFLKSKGFSSPKVSIGRDPRLTGAELSVHLAKGLYSQGASLVYDFGICTTPAMFESTQDSELDCSGAVMVTASHLPADRNGFKFFTKSGGTDASDIAELLDIAATVSVGPNIDNASHKVDYLDVYAANLARLIQQKTGLKAPFKGFKIIVDAGGGSGGFFVDKVLKTLGANTSGSVFIEPDGTFSGHVPNPEDLNALSEFAEIVKAEKADLGIIFDTDVDRAAIIDKGGGIIGRSKLIALMSSIILADYPNTTIVTDSVTSISLKSFIEDRGGVHCRYMRGYNNVIKKAISLNEEGIDSQMAIETSGHCALKENRFLDDGAYLAVRVLARFASLAKEGKSLSSDLAGYEDPRYEFEARIDIASEDFKKAGAGVIKAFSSLAENTNGWEIEEPNYEGVRINATALGAWILMRMSLHDPVIVINVETQALGSVPILANWLREFFEKLPDAKQFKTGEIDKYAS